MVGTRTERDSLGTIQVPQERLWGAQTQRCLDHFAISKELMPFELIRALSLVKKAGALVNQELGLLDSDAADAIVMAAEEVIAGEHGDDFPLVIWQGGSGTQSHMNVCEVIANRASELTGGVRGAARSIHTLDQVSLGQSSNDSFPTAMAIAALEVLRGGVLPHVKALRDEIRHKADTYRDVVKLGRTHLMDATPITLGQEFGAWVSQLNHALNQLEATLPYLSELPVGGTSVGTGHNAHPEMAARMAEKLTELTGFPLRPATDKLTHIAAHDAFVQAHGALKALSVVLAKIAGDVRLLTSGPRSGLGELTIPVNEPGSSVMPGKANPSQAEAVLMIAALVQGHDVSITIAGASGALQLNAMKPLIAYLFLESARTLSDVCESFRSFCIAGLEPNLARIEQHLNGSLMLATALVPHLGWETSNKIVRHARDNGLPLRAAALELGLVTAEQFDQWVVPAAMTKPERLEPVR